MPVEARQFNLFPRNIISNRELMLSGIDGNGNVFGSQIGYGMAAGTTTATELFVPVYGSAIAANLPVKTPAMKFGSVVTNVPISRKRSREANDSLLSSYPCQDADSRSSSFTFLGEDISFEIQQQQLEMDRFIAQHIEKMRSEIDQRQKSYCWRIEENLRKKLKAKDEEMEKIAEINWELEEKLKHLWMENRKWREWAERNEATAKALRCSLEQVMLQVEEEAESCWERNSRMCRKCEKEESSVVVLPCRHLCVCTNCVASLQSCPICNSTKTASIEVNLSSS